VEQQLKRTSAGDRVALLTFDRQPRVLVSFAEWSGWPADQRAAMAQQRLATVAPGWMGTQLGLALTTAAELFSDDALNGTPARQRELVVISDLQEGARLDGLQGFQWPAGVGVDIERVDAPRWTNAGLQLASDSTGVASVGIDPRVRIVNASDSRAERFRFGWSAEGRSGFVGETVEAYVPPGQTRTFIAPKPLAGATPSQLRLTGDEEEFDNTAWFARSDPKRVTVLYFGTEAANDPAKPRYYLQRAFPKTPGRDVQVISPTVDPSQFPPSLADAGLVVVPSELPSDRVAAVRDWLTRGGTALLVLTDAAGGGTFAGLTGLSGVQFSEATGNYALLGEMDFTHPMFAPFADPKYSDFTAIHFWKHRHLEIPAGANAHVLARFDDGAPAIAQFSVGSGNLLVLASGWQPADSQLALSTKFVPLLQSLLDWSGAGSPPQTQFQTGDALPSPVAAGAEAVRWRKPDGSEITVPAGSAFTATEVPGIYLATTGNKAQRFAVNLPLEESRTGPLAVDELVSAGVPMRATVDPSVRQAQERKTRLEHEELENRQKLWRWLILAVLAITFVEIAVGGWLARRKDPVEATP
jgi:hypothetical protein